ncbi:MAG TPA: class I SAM-dependent methyltransferase [Pseudomonadales bacterium]|jgi:SAM-dependent methyltransferase
MSLETVDFARLKLAPGDNVLDLGCGEGRHAITAYLREAVTVVGMDLSLGDLTTARQRYGEFRDGDDASRRVDFILATGHNLPFADATFDKVICAEVLEHIHDYENVLGEIHRVLKPGGTLAVSVPRFGPEWLCWRLSDDYHQVEGGHVRIFRSRELRRSIEACAPEPAGARPVAGKTQLSFQSRHFAHGLHSPYWWLRCLFWRRGESVWPVRLYHRFLVWDLMRKPLLTRVLERALNPLIGKSVVMYFHRGAV